MILKILWKKYDFYIFDNQLKDFFVFNYKIIIINLLFKILCYHFLYMMILNIYMFNA